MSAEHEPSCPRAQFWDAGEAEAPCTCRNAEQAELVNGRSLLVVTCLLVLVSCSTAGPPAPTPIGSASSSSADLCGNRCVLNLEVSESTIGITICVKGWTATVRPPESYTSALKAQQMQALHLSGSPSDYEEDHRLPLELGGDPRAPHNLSPEAHPGSSAKDVAENAAKQSVCSHQRTLAQAQADFIATWLGPWPAYLR